MRRIPLFLALVSPITGLLLGCSLARPRPAPAFYDLGPPPALAEGAPLPRLVLAPVRSGSTLDTVEIRYRFTSDPYRARAYTESRWLASPVELFERRLQATIDAHPAAEAPGAEPATPTEEVLGGHRLEIELEAFEQIFDAADSARVELRFRAALYDARTRAEIGRRLFARSAPSPSADAGGAVTALAELTDATLGELLDWIRTRTAP